MNKKNKVFQWGTTGVTALWEEQVPQEVVKTELRVRQTWLQALAVPALAP